MWTAAGGCDREHAPVSASGVMGGMTTQAGRRAPGRPRDPEAATRILQASLEVYAEHGWSGFTIDAVAKRAGVGKSTIYLRWTDRETLLTDAVALRTGRIEQVDTGSLEGDLTALAGNRMRHYLDPTGWAT